MSTGTAIPVLLAPGKEVFYASHIFAAALGRRGSLVPDSPRSRAHGSSTDLPCHGGFPHLTGSELRTPRRTHHDRLSGHRPTTEGQRRSYGREQAWPRGD